MDGSFPRHARSGQSPDESHTARRQPGWQPPQTDQRGESYRPPSNHKREMYFAPVRWLTLCAVAVLTVVGCADSSIHDEQAVKQAFAEQGYDLRPLFDNGPLVPRGSSTEFAVIVAGSSDEAERFFAPLEDRSSTTYDV